MGSGVGVGAGVGVATANALGGGAADSTGLSDAADADVAARAPAV